MDIRVFKGKGKRVSDEFKGLILLISGYLLMILAIICLNLIEQTETVVGLKACYYLCFFIINIGLVMQWLKREK